MKKVLSLIALVLVAFSVVAFGNISTQEVRMNMNKIEAVELLVDTDTIVSVNISKTEAAKMFLLDGVTEFIPGDPIYNIDYLVVFGSSGTAYTLENGHPQFKVFLYEYFGLSNGVMGTWSYNIIREMTAYGVSGNQYQIDSGNDQYQDILDAFFQ